VFPLISRFGVVIQRMKEMKIVKKKEEQEKKLENQN
jgi:hypothetical protein